MRPAILRAAHYALLVAPLLTGCLSAEPDAAEEGDAVSSDAYGVRSCPKGSTIKGVDVSYFQGSINWNAAKNDGIKFGIARVADGNSFVDPKFAENWQRMKSAGVVRGAYQFFRPDQGAASQANLFLDKLEAAGGLKDGDLPPTLDVEVTEGQSRSTIVSRMRTWLTKVKEATGRAPMIYTSPGFWSTLGNPSGFGEYPLWVAHWGVDCPNVPSSSWNSWSFWQRTDKGSVAGISGGVDVDAFNGSLADLLKFASPKRTGAPVASSWAEGRLDVFARDADDHLVHKYFRSGEGWSSGWGDLGGKLTSDPAVVSWGDGRIDVFARGASNHLVHKWYVKGSGWSGWEDLGGTLHSTPAVSSWKSGRLDVFARGAADDLVHIKFESGAGWSTWESLGGTLVARPAAVSWGEGRIDVFARGEGGDLVHRSYEDGGAWSAWEGLGGDLTSSPTVSSWAEGRLDVFARGDGDRMLHRYYTASGGWRDWSLMAGSLGSSPGAVSWASGRIDVFARGNNQQLVHRWYKSGDGWFAWENLGAMP